MVLGLGQKRQAKLADLNLVAAESTGSRLT
jgi:hypothetical protein